MTNQFSKVQEDLIFKYVFIYNFPFFMSKSNEIRNSDELFLIPNTITFFVKVHLAFVTLTHFWGGRLSFIHFY